MRHEPEILPSMIDALYATGHWLYSQLRIEQAIPVFQAMVHLAPEDERGWLGLGACHEVQEQAHVALEIYGVAAAVVREGSRCELARARILLAQGREREAEAAIAEAAQMADCTRDADVRALVAEERRKV